MSREDLTNGRVTELEAVTRMKGGDIGGLEVLVQRHEVRAMRTAYLILGDVGLAQDVVQDAFMRAHERIRLFDAERPFAPWLMRIVVNVSIRTASRERRERSRARPLETDGGRWVEVVDRDPGPHELTEWADLRRRVVEALEQLPPAQRAAIVQRYYLDMSEAEMAEYEDAPPGTIKWRLHAARKKLSGVLNSLALAAQIPADVAGATAPTLTDVPDVSQNHKEAAGHERA